MIANTVSTKRLRSQHVYDNIIGSQTAHNNHAQDASCDNAMKKNITQSKARYDVDLTYQPEKEMSLANTKF